MTSIENFASDASLSYVKEGIYLKFEQQAFSIGTFLVNVLFLSLCSYTLFQMFDDLILLAKGGFSVYHGPVKKVEEYFSGLGIIVPERVNPPDYYIDILEGMVKTSSSSGVSYTELPVRWMLYNGYPIPPDMRINTAGPDMPAMNIDHGHNFPDSVAEEQSFAEEVWQDVKANVERKRDMIRHNFLKSADLSYRRTPSTLMQYKYFLGRYTIRNLI